MVVEGDVSATGPRHGARQPGLGLNSVARTWPELIFHDSAIVVAFVLRVLTASDICALAHQFIGEYSAASVVGSLVVGSLTTREHSRSHFCVLPVKGMHRV